MKARVEVYIPNTTIETIAAQGDLPDFVRRLHLMLGMRAQEEGWRAGPLMTHRGSRYTTIRRQKP